MKNDYELFYETDIFTENQVSHIQCHIKIALTAFRDLLTCDGFVRSFQFKNMKTKNFVKLVL